MIENLLFYLCYLQKTHKHTQRFESQVAKKIYKKTSIYVSFKLIFAFKDQVKLALESVC